MLHPVGSLPPGVYWFRRLLAAVLVLLVLVVGWWLFAGRGSGGASAGPSSSPGPSASSTPSTSASQTPSTTASASATHSATASTSSTAVAACASSAIRVLAQTDQSSYSSTAKPRFTLQVTNAGTTSCRRDLGQSAVELIVQQAGKHVWSSDDCNPGGGSAIATLRPGQTFSTTVVWERQTSKAGCPAGQPAAAAGSYQLVARNLAQTSAPAAFRLQ